MSLCGLPMCELGIWQPVCFPDLFLLHFCSHNGQRWTLLELQQQEMMFAGLPFKRSFPDSKLDVWKKPSCVGTYATTRASEPLWPATLRKNPKDTLPSSLQGVFFQSDSVKHHLRRRHLSVLKLLRHFMSMVGSAAENALSLKQHVSSHGNRVKMHAQGFLDLFFEIAPQLKMFSNLSSSALKQNSDTLWLQDRPNPKVRGLCKSRLLRKADTLQNQRFGCHAGEGAWLPFTRFCDRLGQAWNHIFRGKYCQCLGVWGCWSWVLTTLKATDQIATNLAWWK